jgi:hypothetical protein
MIRVYIACSLLMEQKWNWKLLRPELLALIELHLTGQTVNSTAMHQLLDNGMIIDLHGDRLQLTSRGRRMLVRGSPSLWDVAA